MTKNNGTLHNYSCSTGLLLPLINEFTWSVEARAFLYLIGLLYCFLGVAIIADIFMGAIEKITSTTRKVYLSRPGQEAEVVEVRIWNDTVANLTLMALGSSAPEILLSIIEIVGNNFEAGALGPGTIVGSAAFNLLAITAVCIIGVPKNETRQIRGLGVFALTTFFSLIAYLWLLVILLASSKDEVELWEAIVTFLMFPLLVILAYIIDRGGLPCRVPRVFNESGKQIELGTIQPVESMLDGDKNFELVKHGSLDRDALAKFVRNATKMGLTGEDAAKLAAYRLVNSQEHSRIWYRIGAVRDISGSKKTRPQLSMKLKEGRWIKKSIDLSLLIHSSFAKNNTVYDVINEHPEAPDLGPLPEPTESNAIVEFHAVSASVPESVGKFPVTIVRHGRMDSTVSVKVESIDGSAVEGEDFVGISEVLTFGPGESEKQIVVEVIDDNQFEPDEQFYLKLSLLPVRLTSPNKSLHAASDTAAKSGGAIQLGRISIMEITILNDDEPGVVTFEERGILVKESVGVAQIPIVRKHGTDGDVTVRWRTVDKTAVSGKDYKGGEGEIVFKHAETKRVIEIPITNDMMPEKDECFEIELLEPTGGCKLGAITKMAVTITNDEEFNSVLGRLAQLTSANVDSLQVHHDTWISQIKDAMNVNGGDVENASAMDYVMHFFTFGWKILFSLVPPAGLLGGWLCFFTSLGVIGFLTAIVGDLAGIFGCLVGLQDAVTAITFVAMGTSLPDLFASKVAAAQEKYADNAIGNVTGSNSVNVFLGLGLPWLIAAAYHSYRGNKFFVKTGSLAFSVMIYSIAALLAVALLLARRNLSFFGKAELGGPTVPRYASAIFLIGLWMLYILVSSLQSYGHISSF